MKGREILNVISVDSRLMLQLGLVRWKPHSGLIGISPFKLEDATTIRSPPGDATDLSSPVNGEMLLLVTPFLVALAVSRFPTRSQKTNMTPIIV